MAVEATMKPLIRKAVQPFRDYAAAQGWGPEDYRIYVRPNLDWNAIHVVLAARAFPCADDQQNRDAVRKFIRKRLKAERFLRDALGFALLTFDELDNTGLGGIRRSYFDADDL